MSILTSSILENKLVACFGWEWQIMCSFLVANSFAEPRIRDGRGIRGGYMNTKFVMNVRYVWLEIVLLGTAVAIALALVLATLGTAASQTAQVSSSTSAQSFEGMITCSRCGAKHQPALDRSASNCVRACVHAGETFALIDDDSVYLLDGDLGSLKRLAGQRAHVTGTRTGKTIKVVSVTSAN